MMNTYLQRTQRPLSKLKRKELFLTTLAESLCVLWAVDPLHFTPGNDCLDLDMILGLEEYRGFFSCWPGQMMDDASRIFRGHTVPTWAPCSKEGSFMSK